MKWGFDSLQAHQNEKPCNRNDYGVFLVFSRVCGVLRMYEISRICSKYCVKT